MENNPKNNIFVYILVIFFAVFVGSGVFLMMNNKKINNKEQAATTSNVIPTTMPTKGFINLKNNSTINKVNNPLNLGLAVESNGENVTAFDVVVSYDPVSVAFVKADSSDKNFKVYSYKKDNRLTLTVVKTGLSSNPSVFKGEEIIKLVFNPKTKGNFSFKV
ncbi:MAG: hypothetical protein AAB569_06005, partial [Patescibacteria group bacterium]